MNSEEKRKRAEAAIAKKHRKQREDKELMIIDHRQSCGECQEREDSLCSEGEVLFNYDPSNIGYFDPNKKTK